MNSWTVKKAFFVPRYTYAVARKKQTAEIFTFMRVCVLRNAISGFSKRKLLCIQLKTNCLKKKEDKKGTRI